MNSRDDRDQPPALACDMTGASDTLTERMAEYRALFRRSLLGRTRTATGVTFRFRADPGTEAQVSDLARRERACCAFYRFTTCASGREVRWHARVVDEEARPLLDEFYRLPETLADGDAAVRRAFAERGLRLIGGGDTSAEAST